MNFPSDWVRAADVQLSGEELTNEQRATIITMLDACAGDPKAALGFILDVLSMNPRKEIIGYLGAGPLEELLIKHGDECLEEIFHTASVNRKFFECLGYIDLDEEDFSRASEIYRFLETKN